MSARFEAARTAARKPEHDWIDFLSEQWGSPNDRIPPHWAARIASHAEPGETELQTVCRMGGLLGSYADMIAANPFHFELVRSIAFREACRLY